MTGYRIEVPGIQAIICLVCSVPALALGMAYENVVCLVVGAALTALAAIGWAQYWRDVDLILAEVEKAKAKEEQEEDA